MSFKAVLVRAVISFGLFASSAFAPVYALPNQFTFSGIVSDSLENPPPLFCSSFCNPIFPAIGSPITIVMVLDESLAPQSESNPSGTGTSTKHQMTGLSIIDFGLGAGLQTSDFYLRVVDNEIANSAPDRLFIIRDEHIVYRQVPEFWFNVEFDSSSLAFLAGPGVPTTLDLSLTQGGGSSFNAPRGNFSFSRFGGVTSGHMAFQITGVSVSQLVPEPASYALMLAGLAVAGFAASRRRLSQ